MTDLALRFDSDAWSADLALAGGALAIDDGLYTAVVISLFTDARARPDDAQPQAGTDPRGWWGDAFNADPTDEIGSRLWLLRNAKLTDDIATRARDIAREALGWMVSSGVASSVDVDVTTIRATGARPTSGLSIGVSIQRPAGPARQRFDFLWEATARSIA